MHTGANAFTMHAKSMRLLHKTTQFTLIIYCGHRCYSWMISKILLNINILIQQHQKINKNVWRYLLWNYYELPRCKTTAVVEAVTNFSSVCKSSAVQLAKCLMFNYWPQTHHVSLLAPCRSVAHFLPEKAGIFCTDQTYYW